MKSRTKANIIVSLITLVIVLAMMAPVLSVFVKIDNGIHLTADIELGEEAIFEVDGNTPKDSLVTNLSNSYDRGGGSSSTAPNPKRWSIRAMLRTSPIVH